MKTHLLFAQRPGHYEGSISLRKRRTWFAETPTPAPGAQGGTSGQESGGQSPTPPAQPTPTPAPDGTTGQIDLTTLPEAVQVFVRQLLKDKQEANEEAATRRKELERLNQEREDAEAAKLAEQGRYKELYEKALADLETAKAWETQAKQHEAQLKSVNQARIDRIPEELRSTVPKNYSPADLAVWLDENESKLTKQPAPGLDGGARGDRKPLPPNAKETLKPVSY